MRIIVLGSAAGGGVPQWNCDCNNCSAARAQRLPSRRVASIAVTGDGRFWVIVNASADIEAHVAATRPLWPTAARSSPIRAVALTDANVDHTAGLLAFRQAGALDIYSSDLVKTTLSGAAMFEQFDRRFRWHAFSAGASPARVANDVGGGLALWAIPVRGLLPSYAGGAEAAGACIAYRFEHGDKTLVYAPIFLDADAALIAEVERADAAFLDGTCWTDDEMITLGLGTRTSREMGHAPMEQTCATLARVAHPPAQHRFFTHVNNSNPVLDPSSEAAATLARSGFSLCADGLEITL